MDPNDFNPFGGGQDLFASYANNVNQAETLEMEATAKLDESVELKEVGEKRHKQEESFNNKALEDLALGVDSVANPYIIDITNHESLQNTDHAIEPPIIEQPAIKDTNDTPQLSDISQQSEIQYDTNPVEGNSQQATEAPVKTPPALPMSNIEQLAQTHLVREGVLDNQLQTTQQEVTVQKADQVEQKQFYEKFSKEVFVAIEHKNGDIDIVPYDPTNKLHQAKSDKGELVWKKGEEFAVATDELREKLQQAKGKIRHVAVDGSKTEVGKDKVRKLSDSEAAEFKGLVTGYNQWSAVQQIGLQQAQQAKALGHVDEKGSQGLVASTPINSGRVGTELTERQKMPQKQILMQWQQFSKARVNELKEGEVRLATQRTNMAKKKMHILQQKQAEEKAAILRKEIRMQQINGEALAFQRNVQAQEILERNCEGAGGVLMALEQLNDLVPDRMKMGAEEMEALAGMLMEHAAPLEGRQIKEIIVKTPQTLLERGQDGDEAFASERVLVEWSNIVQYLGVKA